MDTSSPSSPSSSIDSNHNPPSSPSSSSFSSICLSSNHYLSSGRSTSAMRTRRGLSTDLSLCLSTSSSHQSQRRSSWPPLKPLLKSATVGRSAEEEWQHGSASGLFVKVYMEGIPIGRKLDLLSHGGYDDLALTLAHMFKTTILCGKRNKAPSDKYYVLTYQDREGDWMMVGDVPWEIFTSTVKRLKITRADRC
ncbi:hypothetical protein SAY87_009277 [Trapa incisa]|uniref:Auxin-responsive protein n=1 Tax=Trapa incisa TaxID=236973 RepID=A0AAN7JUR8_9MYRT|nr:hypothetical protein SAY87_009277 [Trapa incisa]